MSSGSVTEATGLAFERCIAVDSFLFYAQYQHCYRDTASIDQPKPSTEDDYLFVEKPSEDFFCPVTFGLLLQPHLTSCCGKHLSEEAVTRIQREKKACPLCNNKSWSTVLNKYFMREVKSLNVFCGFCDWKGELSFLDKDHICSER